MQPLNFTSSSIILSEYRDKKINQDWDELYYFFLSIFSLFSLHELHLLCPYLAHNGTHLITYECIVFFQNTIFLNMQGFFSFFNTIHSAVYSTMNVLWYLCGSVLIVSTSAGQCFLVSI